MIKIKRLSKVVLLFSIILIFGGCYDYNELNSLDIISGIGLTFIDNEYKVSYEVINTNLDKDNTDSKKSFVVSGTGKNLSEAIESANSKLNKKPYFEHIKVMLIDTNIDIMKISDYLLRSNTISTNFYLALADNPLEILEFTSEDKVINANYVYDILKNINYTKMSNYFDFQVSKILNKIDIALPKIELDKKIIFKTYGLYHKNNFICYLDDNNLEMYKYFLQKNNFSYSNDKNSINFYSNKMKIKLKDNIDINFSLKAKVLALDSEYNLRNNDDFKKLESTFNTSIEENLYKFITFLQEKKTDILGINYKHYLMTQNDDENYFSKTKIKVRVNIGINKPGLTVRGVTNE